ncbi:MAG: DUF2184 domain-containing protein [Rickettsiales bacterium]
MQRFEIYNDKGEQIKLTGQEQARANYLEREIRNNNGGLEVDVTTMTAISKSIVEQKFFTLNIADYIPIEVGNGAFSSKITTYRSFDLGAGFSQGLINSATKNTRLQNADVEFDSVDVAVKNWAASIDWNIFELSQASRANNLVNLITAKEKARKRMWDLGIQELAFVGLPEYSDVKGLLTQAEVTANTSLITKYISAMSDSEYQTFVASIIGAYRTVSEHTSMPNRLYIPEEDYNGLVTPVNTNFAIVSKLEYLEKALKAVTMKPDFKILPLAYAMKANNSSISGLNKNRYVLMNYDPETIKMNIPVDYTNTAQNTVNGFHFENVGYGQFTGVQAYRPKEILYFDFA